MDLIKVYAKSVEIVSIQEFANTDDLIGQKDIGDYFLRYPAPCVQLSEPSQPAPDHVGELFTYFLTNTKFLDFEGFTVDGINIDSLPFDVGFHLGILANPTGEQINEALEFVDLTKYLLDNKFYETKTVTLSNGRKVNNLPFSLGYNFGMIDSEKESKKEYAIKILGIIKTQLL